MSATRHDQQQVRYADPGNKRFPVHTREDALAA